VGGAGERLRPILMTTGAAGLAILPLVIFGDLPGHEIEYPMAVVILGGLVTSTLLNLFILPALYLRFGAGAVLPTSDLTVAASAPVSGRASYVQRASPQHLDCRNRRLVRLRVSGDGIGSREWPFRKTLRLSRTQRAGSRCRDPVRDDRRGRRARGTESNGAGRAHGD